MIYYLGTAKKIYSVVITSTFREVPSSAASGAKVTVVMNFRYRSCPYGLQATALQGIMRKRLLVAL